jgi:hypothetical protein
MGQDHPHCPFSASHSHALYRKNLRWILHFRFLKKKSMIKIKKTMAQVVECLPSKCKALSSNPNITKKKKKNQKAKI